MPREQPHFIDHPLRRISDRTLNPQNDEVDYGDFEWPRLDVRIDNPAVLAAEPNTPPTTVTGKAKQVLDVYATESPSKQQDRIYSLVSVSFTRDPADSFFTGVRIWLLDYKGNADGVLVASGHDSPVSFLVECTGETVKVKVQAFGSDGTPAAFDDAPSVPVVLDGVISAPLAPTIAQTKTAIANGWQFQFNLLTGLLEEVIDGYWIYRSTTDVESSAAKYKYVKHSPGNTGIYTFQDIVASTQYYWVTAMAIGGLESSKTSAEWTGTTSYRPSAHELAAGAYSEYSSASYAYDENQTTYALGRDNNRWMHIRGTVWYGFTTASGSPTTVKLKILSKVVTAGPTSSMQLSYSINGGTDWTPIYSVNQSRAKQVDSITLSASQDLTLVRIEGFVQWTDEDTYGGIGSTVYDIWIEVTT